MKHCINVKTLVAVTGLCSMLFAGTAAAEYRVTAFGYSSEMSALLAGNAAKAKARLGERELTKRDFIEANNLCVARILAREFAAAETACMMALEKLERDRTLGMVAEKSARASIYSNLAVVKALSGDFESANIALESALSLNARDRNAIANYDLVSGRLSGAGLARNL